MSEAPHPITMCSDEDVRILRRLVARDPEGDGAHRYVMAIMEQRNIVPAEGRNLGMDTLTVWRYLMACDVIDAIREGAGGGA